MQAPLRNLQGDSWARALGQICMNGEFHAFTVLCLISFVQCVRDYSLVAKCSGVNNSAYSPFKSIYIIYN